MRSTSPILVVLMGVLMAAVWYDATIASEPRSVATHVAESPAP
jgi:hypothetical protein